MILTLSGLACLVASFLIGLSIQEAANPLMVAPFMLMGAWLVGSGRLTNISYRDPVLWGLLALSALWLQSLFVSGFTFNSKVTLLTLGVLPLSFMVWRTLNLPAICQTRVAVGFLVVALICAGQSLYQTAILHLWRPAGPFLDANLLGILFSLTLLPLVPLILKTDTDKRIRAALIAAFAVLLAGLLATQSRSAFLGTLAGLGFIAYQLRHQIPRTRKFLIGVGAAGLAALAMAFATGLLSRFALLLSGDVDASSRLSIWKTAFEMSLLHPLRGLGTGTFGMVYPLYREPGGDNSVGWWVHMDPLQWAVESGWITAVVFYALAGFIAYRIYRMPDRTPVQLGFIAALLSLFINAHTAYPLHVIPFMILATGMVHILIPAPAQSPRNVTFAGAGLVMIVLTLGLWTGMNCVRTLYSWHQVQEARLTNVYENFEGKMMTCLAQAEPDFPFCRLLLVETTLQMAAQPTPAALDLIKDVQQKFPLLPQPDYFLGLYLEKTDFANTGAAIDAFKASVVKMPTFWIGRRALIEALIRDGQYAQALATLDSGAKYPLPKAARAYHAAMKTELSARITP
jgi:O-antigen ligase